MRTYKTTIFLAVLCLGQLVVAHAGPYDDAMSAKDRGDFAKARNGLQALASQGDATSQFQLSLLVRNGQGGRADASESIKWLRLAAKQGHASAQSNLGAAYSRGWGVPQDPVRAVLWFTLAAASGSDEAKTNREVATRRMTPQAINQASDMAKACLQSNLRGCD